MQLTTKGRYAVTAMLDLASNESTRPVTLDMISQRQNISLSYLEQLFAKLRKAKLVKSVRGPGGGYLLNVNADEVSLTQIIEAVDENIDPELNLTLNKPQKRTVNVAMSNTFGFGGHNACVVFKTLDE